MKRKNFSSFTLPEAYKHLHITELRPWTIDAAPRSPSDFFHERLRRLQARFDLRYCEKSKELTIDAFCEEAMEGLERLKIWKGAQLQSERSAGTVDYLVAERRDYLDTPFLCIVEAKKDDFEQGLAQCLVEMKACQECNAERAIDILGIVTNGEGWRFYRLTTNGEVCETALYSNRDGDLLLGVLHELFRQCQAYL